MQLYLVRHGVTELNEKQVYQGWTDTALTEKGKAQCEAVRWKLRDVRFDAVVSSPLQRTLHSARIISGFSAECIRTYEFLREFNFGVWEGLSYGEAERQYPREWQAWCADWQDYGLPQGESFTGFYQRVKSGFAQLLPAYRGQTVLLVGHAGPLRVIAGALLKMHPEDYWRLSFEFGCYSLFEFHQETPVLQKINC
jgi:alpha-ribazole phosphatase